MDFPSFNFNDGPVRWWQISLIGVIIILSGIDAFFWTPMFIGILITLFGILALVVGGVMIVFYFTMNEDLIYRFPVLFAGILSIIIAAIAIVVPGVIETTFIIIMAFLAIINSMLLILVGCSLSDEWKTRLIIVLFGMLTLFLSILMALFPALSVLVLVKIWGVYAWVIGALCVAAGLSMRGMIPGCSPGQLEKLSS
jgi:uncharacterized membrane protein HdeD (DUF308 family)